MTNTTKTHNCHKCGGSGRIGAFAHIESGTCFTCGGSGELNYLPREKTWTDPHPEWIVPEATRSTVKQWEYLDRLCGEVSDKARKYLLAAGAPMATQRYVSKAVMSKAIDLAKQGRAAA